MKRDINDKVIKALVSAYINRYGQDQFDAACIRQHFNRVQTRANVFIDALIWRKGRNWKKPVMVVVNEIGKGKIHES